ncbi:MAG: ATP-binding protein [Acidobacteriaceae bacterium]
MERASVALQRIRVGKHAKSVLMVGLRGVGKTVLLDRMRLNAEVEGFETIRIEAPEDRSLPAMLAPALRVTLLKLSRVDTARAMGERALRALAGFARSLKVKYRDIEVGLDFEPEPGLADNGDLAIDLTALFEEVGKAARAADTAVVLFIDEVQYLTQPEFAAIITALHRCSQLQLPLSLVGAGLPQLRALAGKAKSYAERLFDYPEIGALDYDECVQALRKPARNEGADITEEAIASIVERTKGYPYFLQEWGKHSWDIAEQSPIGAEDVRAASVIATAALDESFFRVRFDRLTPTEKNYLGAMARLGPGPHRSGDVAQQLGKDSTAVSPVRNGLIGKGMIWSPSFGDIAFTVPLFDEYMRRIMPLERGA